MADTTELPPLGAVYDVGGAMALCWPDAHPCHDTPEHGPWLILHPDGGIEWTSELRDGAKLMGYLPGFDPALEHAPTDVDLADRQVWNELRAAALAAFASSLGYPSWRAYCAEDLASGAAGSRQVWEIVRAAMKGVLPIVERQAAELERERESRLAWAIEADRVEHVAERVLPLYDRLFTAVAEATKKPRCGSINNLEKLIAAVTGLRRERDEALAKLEQSHEINDGWVRYRERVKQQQGDWCRRILELEEQLASRPTIPVDAEKQLNRVLVEACNAQPLEFDPLAAARALLARWSAPVSGVHASTPALDDGIGELMCRDCGHPENPFSDDTSWMCDRHRPVFSCESTTEVPGER
jgi:hypothetical protein